MNNWKSDFEVKFQLEFVHNNGRKEVKQNTLIVEAEDEENAKEIVLYQYENSQFLKINEIKKIWNYKQFFCKTIIFKYFLIINL